MDITAITICVNYSDILGYMIKQNIKFFKKWFIVTTVTDKKTIKLLETYKDVVHILIYDGFYINGNTFNKGGAVKFAQDYIDDNFTDSNILILDADIYLPDVFFDKIPLIIEPNILYGVIERNDYWTLDDFMTNVNPHKYQWGSFFVGFFQLYKQNPMYKYKESYNCSKCDNTFRELFYKKQHLNMSVKHLGQEGVNWNGVIVS